MYLEATCQTITYLQWKRLMKNARPLNYEWLRKRIKKHLPKLYNEIALDYFNPYADQCKVTKRHYILVHSAIEYFIVKK